MKENWAKSLKQKMTGFQQPVDDALWAGIARVSVKTGIRWWPWAMTAAASAAVITTVLLLRPEPVIDPIVVSSGEMAATVEEEPIAETLVKDNTPTSYSNRPVRLTQNIPVIPDIETEDSFPPKNGNDDEKTDDERHTIQDSVTLADTTVLDESVNMVDPAEDEWVKMIAQESAPQRNRVKITASFYAQSSPFGNPYSAGPAKNAKPEPPSESITNPDYPPTTDPGPGDSGDITNPDYPPVTNPGTGDSEDDNDETKAMGRFMEAAQTQSAIASPEWTHAFPLQIGARVSFSWSERWSIDTGLTFVHFYSRNALTQQRMEFLGIPLYVNYVIGSASNFTFFMSAGGQAFKCFAGNAPDKPWLFSCGLRAGAEYNLSPLVSIFAEPGADRYFHTGESHHYYTDNPLAFSFSLGFRLHF